MKSSLYLGKGLKGDLLLSQSTPCPCCYDLAGTCSSRSLTFSQNNAMSECTWHCQLYPARLDRLRAAWQMQSSCTRCLSTSATWCTTKPLFYLQNRPGSQKVVMWIMGQQLFTFSILWIHWSRKWQTEALSDESVDCLRARTLSFTPQRLCPLCHSCPWVRAHLLWQDVETHQQQAMLFISLLWRHYMAQYFKGYTLYFMCTWK